MDPALDARARRQTSSSSATTSSAQLSKPRFALGSPSGSVADDEASAISADIRPLSPLPPSMKAPTYPGEDVRPTSSKARS